MFDKYKERYAKFEADHEAARKVRLHVEKNKNTYFVGAGCLATGFVIRGQGSEIKQIIKPRNFMGIGYKATQTMNTIVLPAKGDPGDVVQNLRTLETYPSKGELARMLGLPRSRVADYFAGRLPNLQGDQFEVIGKGGHPINLA